MTLFAWRASQCSPLLGLTSSSVGRTERRPEVKSEISTYPGLSLVIKHSATPAQAIKIQLNSGFVILFICRKELQQLCIARYTQSQSVTVQSSQARQFLKRNNLYCLEVGERCVTFSTILVTIIENLNVNPYQMDIDARGEI